MITREKEMTENWKLFEGIGELPGGHKHLMYVAFVLRSLYTGHDIARQLQNSLKGAVLIHASEENKKHFEMLLADLKVWVDAVPEPER